MPNRSSYLALSCLFVVFLNACSVIETPEPKADAEPIQNEDLVVESLVSAAVDLSNLNIELLEKPLNSEEAEEVIHQIEPVVPTIAMTPNRVVERAINDYLQNRRTLLKVWIERGHTYFPMIEKIFEEEGIPDELKYIALGESNLRPTARSPAGAVGMWQFMPATGRGAGLEITPWIDERKDPEKATRAAAKHLKELYISYSGNWHLVLAGYNCSYRCITRAVRRAGGSIDNPPSFWEIYPYLPRETRGFIPKFIAASLIVSNPEMYGIATDNITQKFNYDIVKIRGMLSLDDAALLAGVDLATIRKLNPSLRKASLPDSNDAFPLKIPFGNYEHFVNAFANLPAEDKVTPSEYIVSSGDTLGKIAYRFDTTVEELQAKNGIRGHMIRPKQKLLIPGTGVSSTIALASTERQFVEYGEAKYLPIKLGDEFQLVEQTGSNEELPLMAVSLRADVEDNIVVPTIYKVRSGDTLGQISQRFDVSLREIQQWNNIKGTKIFINQELTLHTMGAKAGASLVSTYRVQNGDNLGTIARRFGVTVNNLKRWNSLNGNTIFPGQNLQLN